MNRRWEAAVHVLALGWAFASGAAPASAQTQAQLVQQADTAFQAGRFQEAAGLYSRALTIDPVDLQALWGRIEARVRTSEFEGAHADTEMFLTSKPTDNRAANYRCWLANQRKRSDLAVIDCSRVIVLAPDYAEAYFSRAIAYSRLGDFRWALADASRSIELDPTMVLAWSNRGWYKEQLGDLDGAMADYQKALALDPEHPLAQAKLSALKKKLQESGSAATPPPALPPRSSSPPPGRSRRLRRSRLPRRSRRSLARTRAPAAGRRRPILRHRFVSPRRSTSRSDSRMSNRFTLSVRSRPGCRAW